MLAARTTGGNGFIVFNGTVVRFSAMIVVAPQHFAQNNRDVEQS
jgi:hypothetical protein